MTTFADRVYELGGAPMGSAVPPGGKWFYVDGAHGSDAFDGLTPATAKATVSAAYALCTTGMNDVVCVLASASGINEGAAITWSKNLTHLIGMGAPTHAAQRTRIVCNAADISPFITISGYGCIFENLYLWQGQDDAHSLILVSVSGHRNYFRGVHFAGGGHATQAINGGMSVQVNGGSENLFERCTFGVDTVTTATGMCAVSFPATGGAARNVFRDCLFTLYSGHAGTIFVELLGNAGIDRYTIFERCRFINLSGTAMTEAINVATGFDATNKRVLMIDCELIGATDWEANDRGVVYLNSGTRTGGGNAGILVVSAKT